MDCYLDRSESSGLRTVCIMTMMILTLTRYMPGMTTGSASFSRSNGIILVVFSGGWIYWGAKDKSALVSDLARRSRKLSIASIRDRRGGSRGLLVERCGKCRTLSQKADINSGVMGKILSGIYWDRSAPVRLSPYAAPWLCANISSISWRFIYRGFHESFEGFWRGCTGAYTQPGS